MLLRTLVFEYRIVSFEYFMDKMMQFEANECIRNISFLDRDIKEIGRYQLYVLINSNSKKHISAKEIMRLPWDNKFLNETEYEYSEEEDKKLEEQSNLFTDMLNSGTLKLEENVEAI